jgi:hypothetical protein
MTEAHYTEILRSRLTGTLLWKCTRAADLAAFHFGDPQPATTFTGRHVTVGQYALHVQCPWRIATEEQIVVGSRDLYHPLESAVPRPEELGSFDYEKSLNRRDAVLGALFATRAYRVERVDALAPLGLWIHLAENLSLQVFPDLSTPEEQWRFFSSSEETLHWVMLGSGRWEDDQEAGPG